MKRILLIAAFLYLLIAPLTYHPDNKEVLFWASSANGSVWNIWEYGEKYLPPNKQYGYPPLHFYLDKLQYAIAKPLAGDGYVEWLGTPHKEDLFQPQLARYMAASKIPLILLGLIAGYFIFLLARQFGLSEKRSRLAACIWLFNPITIYSIPMMGQNDVMAIVFFLGGWLVLRRHPKIASIIFGLAMSIKTYPLIWLAFLLPATPGITRKQKVGIFLLSIFVYLMTLVPFLHNPTFLSVGMKPEITNRFLIPQISIGFDQVIYVVPVLLAVVFLATSTSAVSILLTVNLLLLGFSHFHPQWYTWTIPFFALWLASQKKKDTIFYSLMLASVVLVSWITVVVLFADKWLSVGMIGVANPSLGNLPVIIDFLRLRGLEIGKVDSLAHTTLAAVGIISLILLISKRFVDNSADFNLLIFEKIYSQWKRIPKSVRVLLISIVSVGLFGGWIFLMQLIPAPNSTAPTPYTNYVVVNNSVQGSFKVDQNYFYRFDLTLSNPHLSNIGKYQVSLSSNGKILHQQIITGLNIGEDATIRFDIPEVQSDSKGQSYDIKFQALEGTISAATIKKNPEYILASVVKQNDKNTLAVQKFFKPSRHFEEIINNSRLKIIEITTQLPWYYIGLFVLLCLWV
jgi:hypothetical protein